MANFEGLMRQALNSQNDEDPVVRQRIYRSSRNALARMLEKAQGLGEEAIEAQVSQLEESIRRIETEYTPDPEPHPAMPAVPEPAEPGTERPAPAQAPFETSVPADPASQARELDALLAMLKQARQGTAGQARAAPVAPQAHESLRVQPDPEPDVSLDGYSPEALFPAPVEAAAVYPRTAATEPVIAAEPAPAPPAPRQVDRQEWAVPQRPEPSFDPLAEPSAPPADENWPSDDGAYAAGPDLPADDARLDATMEADAPYPVYKRKNPLVRRLWTILLVIGILLVILWIMYAVFTQLSGDTEPASARESVGPVGQTQLGEDGMATITLLEPTDLSGLVTAGRGTAELRTEQNGQLLRLQSVRQEGNTGESAQPILLELERGVLQQVGGKTVTVEFYAKSGMSGPAQFAIECSAGSESICGRKRFRVGQQPERILFSMDLSGVTDPGARVALALNTDITTLADSTGRGDSIDMLYARLRFEP